jgi:hypothetical protein
MYTNRFLLFALLLVLPGCPDEESEPSLDAADSATSPESGSPDAIDAAASSDAASPCPGLDRAACSANQRCLPVFGRTVSDPFHLSYGGCWTAYKQDGTPILNNTVFVCARSKAGAPCFEFGSSATPDGWQQISCKELPADCAATVHPADSQPIGHCEAIDQSACQTAAGCAPVSYVGGAYAGCRSTVDLNGEPIPEGGPTCGRQWPSSPCAQFPVAPPDGWFLEDCSAQCD